MLKIVLLAALSLCSLAACSPVRQDRDRGLYLVPVGPSFSVPAEAGDAHVVRVEVAATPDSQSLGLMHRESLPQDSGMLFVYPREAVRAFWMKNTLIPLSIAFSDAAGNIQRIIDMDPGAGIPDALLPRYSSVDPTLYALEMEKGWFRTRGIGPGDRMRFHEAIRSIRAE